MRPFVFATLVTLGSLVAPSPADAAASYTYEIVVRTYCGPEPTDWCGRLSQAGLEAYYRGEMRRLNLAWKPVGVSFRIGRFEHQHESRYSAITGKRPDIDDPMTVEGRKVAELYHLAAAEPSVITLFIISGMEVCWSPIPPKRKPDIPWLFWGLFCHQGGNADTLAHELGHHFCLRHPHRFHDPVDVLAPNWDGDGLADTPPDPGPFEGKERGDGADENFLGDILNGHLWCTVDERRPTDFGSPNRWQCGLGCYAKFDGTISRTTLFSPDPSLVMNYYGEECHGPYVAGGVRQEGWSLDERALVRHCIRVIPERAGYVDVCEGRGGDQDHDGWCGDEDLCPKTYNVDNGLNDPDGDLVPSECDNCPDEPNAGQENLDGYGAGDACDDDRDGDGCANDVDLRPDEAYVEVGVTVRPGCSPTRSPTMEWEGGQSPDDKLRDCEDSDDDNDKIPDVEDDCPKVKGSDIEDCTKPGRPCLPDWYDLCPGGCGDVFFAELLSRSNPTRRIVFDRLLIRDEGVHLAPRAEMTATEAVRAFEGRALAGGAFAAGGLEGAALGPERERDTLALELVPRDGGERVVIAEWPAGLDVGEVADGTALHVKVTAEGPEVATTWGLGLEPGDLPADRDGDGVPDPADRCLEVADALQGDHDRDGFGDRCDPDFDQDGIVGADDLAFLQGCVSVDPTLAARFRATPEHVFDEEVGPADALKSALCGPADLDGDDDIDSDDVAVAAALEGGPPGPSWVAPAVDDAPAWGCGTLSIVPIGLMLVASTVAGVRRRRAPHPGERRGR